MTGAVIPAIFAILLAAAPEAAIAAEVEAEIEDRAKTVVAERLGVSAGQVDLLMQIALDPYAFATRLRRSLEQMQDLFLNDPTLAPITKAIWVLYQERGGSWSVRARTDGESTGTVGAGIGVDAAYDLGLCRLIGVAGDGELYRAPEGDGFTGYVQATGCLPIFGNTIEMTVRRLTDVRPSLAGLPRTPVGRISGWNVDADLRFLRFRWSWHQLDLMHLTFDFDFLDVDEVPGAVGGYAIGGEVVRWTRRGQGARGRDEVWRFVPLRFEGWGSGEAKDELGDDGQVFALAPIAIEGLALGPVGVDLALWYTRANALPARPVGDERQEEATLGVDTTLMFGTRTLALALGGRRDLDAALGGLVLETRGSLAVEWRRRSGLARAEGWVASQELIPYGADTHTEVLGGGRVGYGVPLGAHVDLWLQAEAGRSWYADLEDTSGEPSFTVRGLASIVAAYGDTF